MANDASAWLFGKASQIVVSAVLAAAVATWQKFSKASTWPEIIAIGLVMFVCLVWAAEKFWHFPLRWRVRQWLDDTGHPVVSIRGTDEFRYIVNYPGVSVAVYQVAKDRTLVIGAFGMRPTDEQLSVFNAWPKQKQYAFWKALRVELIRFGIEFTDLTLEGNGIGLSTALEASNELKRLEFSNALIHVQGAARLYREHLLELFPPSETSAPMS